MAKYSSRQIRRKIIREDTALTCVSRAELWRKGKRIGKVLNIEKNLNILENK
jgi:phosphoribosyl-AMP cyclohydrolase